MNYWELSDLRTRSGASFSFVELPDWKFNLLPANDWNPKYHRAVKRALMQPNVVELHRRKAADDYVAADEDAEIEARMYRDSIMEGCVASWTVTDRAGAPMGLTPANVRAIADAFPALYEAIVSFVTNPANFELPGPAGKAALVSGNSEPISATRSAGGASTSKRSR